MADNNTEDLSTEQILTSIREMLLDGDKKPALKKEQKDEDILELTSLMVIDKPKTKPACKPRLDFNSEEAAQNIIKSFIKTFANMGSVEKNVYISDTSNEDVMLKASISKAVEAWVLKNVKSDFEFDKAVKEEISKQVNAWFDSNFIDMVSSSIKQELERVMVGS